MRGASDCQPHALRSRGSPCKWVKSDVFHSGPMSALCQKHTFCAAVEVSLLFDYLVSGRH